jgi:membrane-associated phospholipid phosphatase
VNKPWWAVAAFGAVVLVASVREARAREIPDWEVRIFRTVNGLPGPLFPLLWPFMQLGNLVVGTVAGLVVAWVVEDRVVAIGVLLALVLKLASERLLRRMLKDEIPARTRPGTSQPGAILRGGDVPATGPSFPSGHVVLVAAVACVVTPVLPAGWRVVPLVLTLLVMFGRVFVGAHNPLDVTGGLGAGLILGGIVASFVRV